ncbi:hypothetical protein Tco_0934549 [Tanacetum coccineum]
MECYIAGELTRLQLIPPGIDNSNLDSSGDILFLESLLYDNSSPRPPEAFQANSDTIIESLPTFPIPDKDSDSLREEINIFSGSDDSIPLDSTIDVVEDIPVDVIPISTKSPMLIHADNTLNLGCPEFLKPLVLAVLSFVHKSFTSSASFGNPISKSYRLTKQISKKRTKNQAKTDKIEHGMERRGKAKVKSKPKSKSKSTLTKSTVKAEAKTE